MNKKKILFINHYTISPSKGGTTRHYELAKRLVDCGYEVSLVGGAYHHHLRRNQTIKRRYEVENQDGFKLIWLRLPKYKNPHGVKRFFNWVVFSLKILKIPNLDQSKPDFIYYSSLSLIGILSAIFLSKYYKAKLIFEIRDIWPLSLICLKGLSKYNPAIILLRLIELTGYKYSDLIITTMPKGYKHIQESGFKNKKIIHLPNGIENKPFKKVRSKVYEEIKEKQKEKFCVGYVGTNGVPNGVETLVLAANELKSEDSIFFTIVGEGPEKSRLVQLSKDLDIKNISFADRVPRDQVQQIVDSFDIVYHGQSIITKLYDYGISPNKMAEYFLQGKPVVNAYSGSGDPVAQFNCGLTVPAHDHVGLAQSILEFYQMESGKFAQFSLNARNAVNNFYDYDVVALSLDEELKKLII